MQKITPVDIQHKSFKKALQGYDRTDVDHFLDEIIETLEDEAQQRAALEAEIADLKERISHFKAIEESLQNTLVLAQRTADEVKASAHKEADLISEQARLASEREIAGYNDAICRRAARAAARGRGHREGAQRAAQPADDAPGAARACRISAANGAAAPAAVVEESRAAPAAAQTRRHQTHNRLLAGR